MAIKKLKDTLSPGVYQMSTELTQSVVKTGRPEIQKIVYVIWDEVNILQQWKKSTVYLFTKGDSVYHRVIVISCIQNFVYHPSLSAK